MDRSEPGASCYTGGVKVAVALLLLAGCDVVFGLDEREGPDAAEPGDAVARVCEPGAPFVSMADVPIAGSYSVEAARFNPTQTIAYLSLCVKGQPVTTCDLYLSPYTLATNQFSAYAPLDVNNSTSYDSYGTVTPDAKYLVFGSRRSSGLRTYISEATGGRFLTAAVLNVIPNVSYVNEPYLSSDGQTLHLAGAKIGGTTEGDIYRARGGPPTYGGDSDLVAGVNTPGAEAAPVISDDELEIFFSSDRESTGVPAGAALDLFVATRSMTNLPFDVPVKLPALSTVDGIDWPVWLSPDRCDLYYINKVNDFATLRVAHR